MTQKQHDEAYQTKGKLDDIVRKQADLPRKRDARWRDTKTREGDDEFWATRMEAGTKEAEEYRILLSKKLAVFLEGGAAVPQETRRDRQLGIIIDEEKCAWSRGV